MSAYRCRHGTVLSDQLGSYRCYECEPLTEADIERELQATEHVLEERLEQRDRRIAELERVVAQLCERAGIAFTHPPESE